MNIAGFRILFLIWNSLLICCIRLIVIIRQVTFGTPPASFRILLGRETQETGTKFGNLLAKASGIALQGVQNGGGGIRIK